MIRHAFVIALLALAPGAPAVAAQTDLWTVNVDGSGDFTSVQAAVDAAAPGDVVLIAQGVYIESVVVSGKGLTLMAPTGGLLMTTFALGPAEPSLHVRDLPADQVFVLDGLTVFNGNAHTSADLLIEDCDGAVWLQDVFADSYGAPSLRVTGSASVVIADTMLQTNLVSPLPDGTPVPGPGAVLENSTVYSYESDYSGSHGALQALGVPTITGPAPGGPGMFVLDSVVHASGGFAGGSNGGTFIDGECQVGGDGGDGVLLAAGGLGTSAVVLRDVGVSGGSAGILDPKCAPPAADGVPINALGGTVDVQTMPSRSLDLPGSAQFGQSFPIEVDGELGDTAWLFTAAAPMIGTQVAGLDLHLDLASLTMVYALPLSPWGDLTLNVTVAPLPGAPEVVQLPIQAVFLDTVGGRQESAPTMLVLH